MAPSQLLPNRPNSLPLGGAVRRVAVCGEGDSSCDIPARWATGRCFARDTSLVQTVREQGIPAIRAKQLSARPRWRRANCCISRLSGCIAGTGTNCCLPAAGRGRRTPSMVTRRPIGRRYRPRWHPGQGRYPLFAQQSRELRFPPRREDAPISPRRAYPRGRPTGGECDDPRLAVAGVRRRSLPRRDRSPCVESRADCCVPLARSLSRKRQPLRRGRAKPRAAGLSAASVSRRAVPVRFRRHRPNVRALLARWTAHAPKHGSDQRQRSALDCRPEPVPPDRTPVRSDATADRPNVGGGSAAGCGSLGGQQVAVQRMHSRPRSPALGPQVTFPHAGPSDGAASPADAAVERPIVTGGSCGPRWRG
jgi:hypothetical protein